MAVKLIWSTDGGDELVAYMARVSNPENQDNTATAPKLIKYLIDHKHWSPFAMVNACVEIETTRDISRQVLRHSSLNFQEFSQRYAEVSEDAFELRSARLQDKKNRQNSIEVEPGNDELAKDWEAAQQSVLVHCDGVYREFLAKGIAKEQARAVLPEGLTKTRMYVNGTLRSWIHYWDVRCDEATQKEHRLLAEQTREVILLKYPLISEALGVRGG